MKFSDLLLFRDKCDKCDTKILRHRLTVCKFSLFQGVNNYIFICWEKKFQSCSIL